LCGVTCVGLAASTALLAAPPEAAQLHYQAGLVAKGAKDYDRAISELSQALELYRDYPEAHWALAWVYVAKGDRAAATREFKEVILLVPGSERCREARAAIERIEASATSDATNRETAVQPEDGHWEGKGDGWEVKFVVDQGGEIVRWVQVLEYPIGEDGRDIEKVRGMSSPEPMPVQDGSFAARWGPFRGVLKSRTEAEGTWASELGAGKVNWTARRTGPAPRYVLDLTPAELIIVAALLNDAAQAQRLLNIDPNCISANNHIGETALHIAAELGDPELVGLLVTAGADVLHKDIWGGTPLHVAAGRGRLDILELLLDKCSDINALGKDNKTALCLAAERGHLEVAKALIARGAELNQRDALGHTPLYWAKTGGHADMILLLRAHGARQF
jgi:tetratricopeptide (TPR) repeat protein